jgi:hypothetical protein
MASVHCCVDMDRVIADPELASDIPIVYSPKFREYGIKILDGGESVLVIKYCPWCGQKLPTSLRRQWFDTVDALGIDVDAGEIPSEFLDDTWWKMREEGQD